MDFLTYHKVFKEELLSSPVDRKTFVKTTDVLFKDLVEIEKRMSQIESEIESIKNLLSKKEEAKC